MKLTEHTYLLSGFCYGQHPNLYGVLPPQGGLVLIDTGLDEEDLAVMEEVRQRWGIAEQRISHVLLTHSHFDHAGNARYMRERGAALYAGAWDAEGIAAGDGRTIDYAYSRPFPACPVDHIVTDGERLCLDGLEATCHHVPGHTRGSMAYECMIDGLRVLFTGDFIQVGTDCGTGIPGVSVGEDFDPECYLDSVKRIRAVRPDLVLGGHFQPCLRQGWRVLDFTYRNLLAGRALPFAKE